MGRTEMKWKEKGRMERWLAVILFSVLFLGFYLGCYLVEFNIYVIKCFICLIKYFNDMDARNKVLEFFYCLHLKYWKSNLFSNAFHILLSMTSWSITNEQYRTLSKIYFSLCPRDTKLRWLIAVLIVALLFR